MTKKKKKRYRPKSLGRLIGKYIMRGIITFMVVITYSSSLHYTLSFFSKQRMPSNVQDCRSKGTDHHIRSHQQYLEHQSQSNQQYEPCMARPVLVREHYSERLTKLS